MKKNIVLVFVGLLFFIGSCKSGQVQNSNYNLSEVEFAQKIKETPGVVIIDVRTPEEFSGGHLANSKNIDWNGDDFSQQTAKLDKSKPVMVYCRSGARSASAAAQMRQDGFTEVYELNGGIMNWVGANLPVTTEIGK